MNNIMEIAAYLLYGAALIAAVTLPIWGYKLIENKIKGKHKALRVTREDASNHFARTGIIASIGTTTTGVFIIQILPLIFSVIGEVGADFNFETVYSTHLADGVSSDNYVGDFLGLTAQLGDMLQEAAPMAAVGLGGYNLINNISRGLPAIFRR